MSIHEFVDESSTDPEPKFTYHFEPPEQGGKKYVRCEGWGRELLTDLGGQENLVHADECSNGG